MKGKIQVVEEVSVKGLSLFEANRIYQDIKKTKKFKGLKAKLKYGGILEVTYWVKEG